MQTYTIDVAPLKLEKERTSLKVTFKLNERKDLANYAILFKKLLVSIREKYPLVKV